MYRDHEGNGWRRASAGLAALAVHGVFAAALIWGLSIDTGTDREPAEAIAAFEISPPPVPPPEPPPEPDRAPPNPEPAPPAPEGREGEALPVAAPVPEIPLAPTPAAPVASEGRDASTGAGTRGAGPGAGGSGSGSGAGGEGGGIAIPARRIAGQLRDSDYPRAAAAARMTGTVAIGFRVRTDGRVDRCSVVRSSGHPLLDDLTCRLFTERYRFRPATTARGQAVESTLQTHFTWGTRRR